MKPFVYALASIGIVLISYAETKKTSASFSDQNINIHIDNNPSIHIPVSQTSNQAQTTSVSQNITQTVSVWLSSCAALLTTENLQKEFFYARAQTHSYLKNHTFSLIAGGVLSTYALLCYKTIKGAQYLGKASLWSSWKRNISVTALQELPQEHITRELLIDIQKRYTQADKPTEFMLPLIHFLYDIDSELKQLKLYDQMGSLLIKTKLYHIVPFEQQRFATTKERLARLAFVKNLFLSWAAEYKLEHNKSTVLTQLRCVRPDFVEEL